MKFIRLGDICDLKNGYAFKSTDYVDSSNTLNCRMSNIRPGAIFDPLYNPKFLPDEFAEKYSEFVLEDGDIVIAMTDLAGDPKILGVPAQVATNGNNILLNQRVGKLIIKNNDVDFRYLKYNLSNPKNRNYYKKFSGGGLQINVSKKDILNLKIPFHDKKDQLKIVKILDIINYLINVKNDEIKKCDELIKSQFVEMFNDEDRYPKEYLKDNIIEMFIGPFGSALKNECFVNESDSSCVVYEQKHAINKYLGDFRFVNSEKHKELKRFEILPNDIIVSCRGTIGETYVIPEGAPLGIMHPSIMKIRLDNNKYNPVFFNEIIKQYLKDNINMTKGGTIKMGIKATDLKKTKFIRPEIDEQKKFISIKNQIDKQKSEFEESLKKLEELQSALMQEYFG